MVFGGVGDVDKDKNFVRRLQVGLSVDCCWKQLKPFCQAPRSDMIIMLLKVEIGQEKVF